MTEKKEPFLQKCLKIGFVVILYWITSISMVFLNKQLLGSEQLELDAPFFVTFVQCFVSVWIFQLSSFLLSLKSEEPYTPMVYDWEVSRKVLPLSCCFVGMITFNNLSLQDLGIAFYTIGRSLTTLFNVILSYCLLKKSTPVLALLCCVVILFGYLLGIDAENNLVVLSFRGVLFGALASFFVCLNAIYTTKTLPHVKQSLMTLGYYNNLNSCILLIPMLFISPDITSLLHCPNLYNPYLWIIFVVVGTFGFLTGLTSSWQIQVTTPLTHNVSGTAKACAQTVMAVIFFNTPKTYMWWISNLMVLSGSFLYALIRRNAMKKEHEKKLLRVDDSSSK